MAYTYRDFLNECENYQYSKEYYEIMKESAELMLMHKFIENQQFAMENTTTFSEGYLMESVNEDYIREAEEKFTAKAAANIKKICASIIKVIKNFFQWNVNLFKKLLKLNKYEKVEINEEEKDAYTNEFVDIMKKLNSSGVQILDKNKHIIPCAYENKDKVLDYLKTSLKKKKFLVSYTDEVIPLDVFIRTWNSLLKLELDNNFINFSVDLMNKIKSRIITVNINDIERQIESSNNIKEGISKALEKMYEELSDDIDFREALVNLNILCRELIPPTSKCYAALVEALNSIDTLSRKIHGTNNK